MDLTSTIIESGGAGGPIDPLAGHGGKAGVRARAPPTYSLSLSVLSRGFADIGKPALASEMARDFLAFQTMVAT